MGFLTRYPNVVYAKLIELDGKIAPASLTKGERFAFIKADAKLLKPLFDFKQHGK